MENGKFNTRYFVTIETLLNYYWFINEPIMNDRINSNKKHPDWFIFKYRLSRVT